MGLFGILFGKESPGEKKFNITREDEKWVDNSFGWLLVTFGYPKKKGNTFLFNSTYFPVTFKAKKISIDNLLEDLCNLFSIYKSTVSYTLIPDIRDIPQTPHSIQGKAFESDIEVIKKDYDRPYYTIHVANSLIYNEELLLRRLIIELTKVKVNEKLSDFISDGDVSYFTYIASIYFGFGVIISKALINVSMQYTAGWQKTSNSKAEVPPTIIAYALAFNYRLNANENTDWKNELPKDIKNEFEQAIKYLETGIEKLFFNEQSFKNDAEVKKHVAKARGLSTERKFEEAIKEYDLAIPLVNEAIHLSVLYNNVGYACQKCLLFEKSTSYFQKALEVRPDFAYALNNLGFTFIMLNQLENGKECLDKVVLTDDNLKGYLYRNLAIFYMKECNMDSANSFFRQAFEMNKSIDLLEYFYATCLLAKSEKEEAMRYLAISVEKGERQGIELMNSFK